MKIIVKIDSKISANETFFSFEYFPPKTEQGVQNLLTRFEKMGQLNPLFMDITWGAGGSTSDLSKKKKKKKKKFLTVFFILNRY